MCFCVCRPEERSGEDVDIILARLKSVKAFEKFHPVLLQQICLCGFYDCLEKGIHMSVKHTHTHIRTHADTHRPTYDVKTLFVDRITSQKVAL